MRKGLLVAVLGAGLIFGRIDGAAPAGDGLAAPHAERSPEQLRRELFDAVHTWLAEAHAAQQDMPKRIIGIERLGVDRYRVHMEMIQGEGWFEVSRDGAKWRVKGLPVPSHGGGGGGA